MKVVLREDMHGLGQVGDIVDVKDGYARNFLIPLAVATAVTPGFVREAEHLRKAKHDKQDREIAEARALSARLEALRLTIKARAGEEGRLFGSVTPQDIATALQGTVADHKFDRRRITVKEPIRQVGEHQAKLSIHSEVEATLTVEVVALDA